MEKWLMAVIAVAIIGLIVWLAVVYNKLTRLRNYKEEAFATMDVYLKKRSDMIPNLAAVAGRYAEHEASVFVTVSQLRSARTSSMSRADRMTYESGVEQTISEMRTVAEHYPALKADQQFLNIQGQLALVEDEIANARKYYNGVVQTYNTVVEQFPGNIAARLLGFSKEVMFTASAYDRENIHISF